MEALRRVFMPVRSHPICLAICLIVSCAALPAALPAQSANPCNDGAARQGWEDKSSPVYADAINLARELSSRGLGVECIRRSKEEHLFEGQKGAAWFQTSQGSFEVWFLAAPETFAGLE